MNDEICPTCQRRSKKYNEVFDFWQCEICFNVWSDGLGDPDYDDDISQACQTIAESNIEKIQQWQARD